MAHLFASNANSEGQALTTGINTSNNVAASSFVFESSTSDAAKKHRCSAPSLSAFCARSWRRTSACSMMGT